MGICVLIVTDTYRYIFLLIFIFIFSFVHAIGQCDKKDKNRKTFNDDRGRSRECKIVCVNRYCMNLLYAPYWGKQR